MRKEKSQKDGPARTWRGVLALISQLLRVAVIELDVLEPGRLRLALQGVDAVAVRGRRLGELCTLAGRCTDVTISTFHLSESMCYHRALLLSQSLTTCDLILFLP